MKKEVTIRGGDGEGHETVSVEEIENGFLITKSRDYKDENEEWQYERKLYYSKTNPLAEVSIPLIDSFVENED